MPFEDEINQALVKLVAEAKQKHLPVSDPQHNIVGFTRLLCRDGVTRFLPTLTLEDGNLLIVGYQLYN